MSTTRSTATEASEPLVLYRLQACPFCERVVRRLHELDIDYESRFVEAQHSERDAVKRACGKRTVPAISDPNTGVTMAESANIVEYLDGTYGSAPDGRVRRGRARRHRSSRGGRAGTRFHPPARRRRALDGHVALDATGGRPARPALPSDGRGLPRNLRVERDPRARLDRRDRRRRPVDLDTVRTQAAHPGA